MAVATFDTLKFANTLKAAGVPPQQAEAQAVAFAEVIQLNLSGLATKEDVDRATIVTKEDVAGVKQEIERVAKQAKVDLDLAVKELRHEIKQEAIRLEGRIDTLQAKLTGDMNLLCWMFGATFAGVVTAISLLIRMSLSR